MSRKEAQFLSLNPIFYYSSQTSSVMYYIMTGPTREHSTAVPTYDKWLLLPVNDEGRERNKFGNEEKE